MKRKHQALLYMCIAFIAAYICIYTCRFYLNNPEAFSLLWTDFSRMNAALFTLYFVSFIPFMLAAVLALFLERKLSPLYFSSSIVLLFLREWQITEATKLAIMNHNFTSAKMREGYGFFLNLCLVAGIFFLAKFYEFKRQTEQISKS